jgi:hypothetical protein
MRRRGKEEVARAHAWLSGPKKGLLSSIVVGTRQIGRSQQRLQHCWA